MAQAQSEMSNFIQVERVTDANDSIKEKRLPKYALTDRIQLAYMILLKGPKFISLLGIILIRKR